MIIPVIFFLLKSKSSTPTLAEIDGRLRTFLASGDSCPEPLIIDNYRIIKIGDYQKGGPGRFKINGRPVYAVANLRCRVDNSTINITDENPCAYVKQGILGYEVFIPNIFKEAQAEFQKEIDKLADKMFQDLDL